MSNSPTPWTVARHGPLSMGFSRQEFWSGLPCPPPGGSSWQRNWTHISYVSCTSRQVIYHWWTKLHTWEHSQCKEIKCLSRLFFVYSHFPYWEEKKNPQPASCQNPSTGQGLGHEQGPDNFLGPRFQFDSIISATGQDYCKRIKCFWHGREEMAYSTESKVSRPKTDKPANYLRFLPSKMSRPRLLVPVSHTCFGPLTLLEFWQLFHSNHEESLETIVTIQFSLPSSTLPITRNRGFVPT